MAARLTDKDKQLIIADRLEGASVRQLATKYGVSATTVQKVLQSDTKLAQKLTHKKEQNTADVLAYMESKRDIVCEIIGTGLDVLRDPEKLASATPAQITTALGTLIDKWTAINRVADGKGVQIIDDI